MHIPKFFEITDNATIENFIRENGFATIISPTNEYPVATHIPIEIEINGNGEKVLWGHVSKANEHWKLFDEYTKVLVIFLAPVNHYISSSWYGHPNAPTWNYVSIHISGTIKIIEGDELIESIRRLTHKYEKISRTPISFDTLPEEVLKQMNGLVGFEIKIERTEAAFKLSQNRKQDDFNNIIKELRLLNTTSSNMMANVMESQHKN
jgi:transcriptional regulator